MIKKSNNTHGNAHRVITFLTRDEIDFLDKIGKDALFSAGSKLSRSKIISAIVNVISKIEIDGCGLSSKKELEQRIVQALKKLAKNIFAKSQKKEQYEERKEGEHGEVV